MPSQGPVPSQGRHFLLLPPPSPASTILCAPHTLHYLPQSVAVDWGSLLLSVAIVISGITCGLGASHKLPDWRSKFNIVGTVSGLSRIIFTLCMMFFPGENTDDETDDEAVEVPWTFYVAVALPCVLGILISMAISSLPCFSVRMGPPPPPPARIYTPTLTDSHLNTLLPACGACALVVHSHPPNGQHEPAHVLCFSPFRPQLSKPERSAVCVECCFQNIAIAQVVAISMYKGPKAASALRVPFFYGAVEVAVVGLFCFCAWKANWTFAPRTDPFWKVVSENYQEVAHVHRKRNWSVAHIQYAMDADSSNDDGALDSQLEAPMHPEEKAKKAGNELERSSSCDSSQGGVEEGNDGGSETTPAEAARTSSAVSVSSKSGSVSM